jgi:hypothetical protein
MKRRNLFKLIGVVPLLPILPKSQKVYKPEDFEVYVNGIKCIGFLNVKKGIIHDITDTIKEINQQTNLIPNTIIFEDIIYEKEKIV